MSEKKPTGMRYLTYVPKQVPDARIVVHNLTETAYYEGCVLGEGGFRAWTEPVGDRTRVSCPCGWAPLLPEHYRVVR